MSVKPRMISERSQYFLVLFSASLEKLYSVSGSEFKPVHIALSDRFILK